MPSPLCSVKPSLTGVRVDLLTQPYPTNPRPLSVRPVVPSARSRPDGNVLRDAAKTRRCASRHRMGARRPLPPAQSARKPTVAVREAARKQVARGGPAAARGRRASARARSRLRRPTLRLCPHLMQCLWTRLPARLLLQDALLLPELPPCFSTASGSKATSSSPSRTASTCSPSRGSCALATSADRPVCSAISSGRNWPNCAGRVAGAVVP